MLAGFIPSAVLFQAFFNLCTRCRWAEQQSKTAVAQFVAARKGTARLLFHLSRLASPWLSLDFLDALLLEASTALHVAVGSLRGSGAFMHA